MKVLVSDPIGQEGIDILTRNEVEVDVNTGLPIEELIKIIPNYDGLIVRSQTQVTADVIKAGKKLQIVGRAGVGVNNIDLEAATNHGVIVVNAPEGNTIAAAEHTIGMMIALSRNIPQGHGSLKNGAWDRKKFMGVELRNKTLGVVGLGKIGAEVSKRCNAFEMNVIAYDPVVSPDRAKNLGVTLVSMDELIKKSDFLTVHVPLTDATRGIIGEEAFKKAKPNLRVVNVARGGVIDEEALFKAVEDGRIAGAAIDVFAKEPANDNILVKSDKIIVTPHLGASTAEAQTGVAVDVAEQIVDVFAGLPARHTVNMPMISGEMMAFLSPFINIATQAGKLVSQLSEGQLTTITIKYDGEIAEMPTDAVKAAAIGGLLDATSEERINLINANIIAQRRGLKVVEQKSPTCENYANLITVEVTTSAGTTSVSGTLMRDETRIVQVNESWTDIVPTGGNWLFSDHLDRPGIIAAVAQVTGKADINISYMHVARQQPRGRALMILALDEALSAENLKEIMAIPDIYTAKAVKL